MTVKQAPIDYIEFCTTKRHYLPLILKQDHLKKFSDIDELKAYIRGGENGTTKPYHVVMVTMMEAFFGFPATCCDHDLKQLATMFENLLRIWIEFLSEQYEVSADGNESRRDYWIRSRSEIEMAVSLFVFANAGRYYNLPANLPKEGKIRYIKLRTLVVEKWYEVITSDTVLHAINPEVLFRSQSFSEVVTDILTNHEKALPGGPVEYYDQIAAYRQRLSSEVGSGSGSGSGSDAIDLGIPLDFHNKKVSVLKDIVRSLDSFSHEIDAGEKCSHPSICTCKESHLKYDIDKCVELLKYINKT